MSTPMFHNGLQKFILITAGEFKYLGTGITFEFVPCFEFFGPDD
jgi:hypothetical protein